MFCCVYMIKVKKRKDGLISSEMIHLGKKKRKMKKTTVGKLLMN